MSTLTTGLQFVADLALGTWFGAMIFFSFVGAPTTFAVLGSDDDGPTVKVGGPKTAAEELSDDDEERRHGVARAEDQVVQEDVDEAADVGDKPGDEVGERDHGRLLDRGVLGR